MKRTLKNLVLWLIAGALLAVLYFGVLYPHKLQQWKAQVASPPENRISGLLQQKNALEEQKAALQKTINAQTLAPSSVFVLFSSLDETMIREAAGMMDSVGCPGLLGIAADDLACWQETGVPGYVQERLQKEWAFCLMLDHTAASAMQAQLSSLNLPTAKVAYPLGTLSAAQQDGLLITLDRGIQYREEKQDGLWHIPAMGNMNRGALDVYNEKKGAGSGVAFLIGNYDADQRYNRDNLAALLKLLREDTQDKTIQCVSPEAAHAQYIEREAQLAPLLPQWDQQMNEIDRQLETVMQQITSSGE